MVDKKKVQEYLKKLQQVDKLKGEIEAIETGFMAHCTETGETVICNLLKVSISKNPPKLVTVTEGGKVTDEMRKILATALEGTDFVKTAVTLEVKKLMEAKAKNKLVKRALKLSGLDAVQTDKMNFEKIVSPLKKA